MLMRHGVRLSPKCADIFDMIERAGERGVAPEILQDVFFANRPRKAAYAGLKAFIWQINELLASTDLHIGMREYRCGFYRVEQRRAANGGELDRGAGRTSEDIVGGRFVVQ
jgi:hypothetical protein